MTTKRTLLIGGGALVLALLAIGLVWARPQGPGTIPVMVILQ